jgi:SNF2 family DNA or RNA helicase
VLVPLRPDVKSLFQDLRPVDATKAWLKHDPSTTLMLRNLGLEVPSPVLFHYDFPHPLGKPPFEVQKDTVRLLTENLRAYVLSTMGVGKTLCPLWAFDYLQGLGVARKMLVVAPLSTLKFVWQSEAFGFLPHLRTSVVYGTRKQRLDALAKDADVYIINHDGVKTVLPELTKKFGPGDALTIDELAVYRNASERSKIMQNFAQRFTWVWGLTGSPAPRQPTDVWGQARIVTPNTVPKFFGRFRDHLMVKINQFKWVPRHDATQKAFEVLKPAVRYTLEDVTELPPYISRRIEVDMGPKQAKVYEQIRQHCFAAVGNQAITAVNAGAALNKMLQISLGWVYSNTQGVIQLDNDARIQTILDIIEAADGKVLVFVPFKHALKGIWDAINAEGWDVAPAVSGDTPISARNQIFNAFQNTDQYKVLPAHPQCMAHGVTLTAADNTIWTAPITSLEIYDQANARTRRVSQKRKQQYHHLQSTKTEARMYSNLINSQDMQGSLLDLFRDN